MHTACTCRAPVSVLRPIKPWHHRVECHKSVAASVAGALAQGFSCRTGCPWRTKMPTPLGRQSHVPPPWDCYGAPEKVCQPASRACAAMTCCPFAMRRISDRSRTSASQARMVSKCMRSNVTLATATRSGPGWGWASPHCTSYECHAHCAVPRGMEGGAGGWCRACGEGGVKTPLLPPIAVSPSALTPCL